MTNCSSGDVDIIVDTVGGYDIQKPFMVLSTLISMISGLTTRNTTSQISMSHWYLVETRLSTNVTIDRDDVAKCVKLTLTETVLSLIVI